MKKNTIMKLFVMSLLVSMTFLVNGQTSKDIIVQIDPHLSFQNYEHFKRLVLNSPDSQVESLAGFDFEWGYTYKVKVRETKLAEPLSDGTGYDYEFLHIVSKSKVADTAEFHLTVDPNRYYYELDSSEQEMNITLKPINDSTFLYFDKVEIEVPAQYQAKFNALITNGKYKRGTFVYINEKRIRLVAL
jgi:hypothetical protein